MKLDALRLHNVRRFAGRGIAVEDMGDGVNVLCAVNEYGKSTCFDALHALFFQAHTGTPGAVQSLRPYSGGSPRVEADIVTEAGRFRLSKQFYGGRHARVTDIGSDRLLAQADEAETFIGGLVNGGAAGPAGLLWVRQGITGLERQSKSDETNERKARQGILSSVQGEVEALTGGRRMLEAMGACEEDLLPLVTPTGRPKTGGPYDEVMKERDALAAEEQRLGAEVRQMREALDARRAARTRLAELEDADEAATRRQKVEQAEAALETARSHRQTLKSAEAEAELLGGRRDEAKRALDSYRESLARARELDARHAEAARVRDEVHERQRRARAHADAAAKAVDAAEEDERRARTLLERLDRAMRAREAAERKKGIEAALVKAEAARTEIEAGEAVVRTLSVPEEALDELEAVEVELAGLHAAAAARVPGATMRYAAGGAGSVSIAGTPLADGQEYPLGATTDLRIGELGTLTIAPKLRDTATQEIAEAEARQASLLERLAVPSLAEARRRDAEARKKEGEIELARQRLGILAPDGIDALRAALARADSESAADTEIEGDAEETRAALDAAANRVSESRNAAREHRPALEQAGGAVVDAEKALAAIAGERERINHALGPEEERSGRETTLAAGADDAEAKLAPVAERVARLRQSAPDVASAEAALARARSAVENASKETATLRETIADLNGRIAARSEEAIEEAWRETADKRAEAEAAVARFEREIALLQRLRAALEKARTAARDFYFDPVLRELQPLMGLLFDNTDVVFDDSTLLPQSLRRDGQVEDVERLSGGMREQLAVLTRLAFARLLAREGQPTPVILDDALVYSDDDRIEKMFDALHRQGRDQQIIVFSCRQRAFSSLGGKMLEMREWSPAG